MGVLLDVVVAPRRLQSSSSNKLCGFASIRSAFLTRSRPLALGSERASSSCDGGRLRSETSSFPHVCAWKHVLFLDVHVPRSSAPKRLAPLRLRRPHKASIFGLCGMPFSEVESKKSETFWFGIFRKVSDAFGAVSDRFRAFRTLSERFGPFQNVSDRFRAFRTVCEKSGTYRFSSLFSRSDLPQAQIAGRARRPRAGDLRQLPSATEAQLSLAAWVASYSFARR